MKLKNTDKITVCSKCLQASCLQGLFMCYEAKHAGTTRKTIKELKGLKLENSCYWKTDEQLTDNFVQLTNVGKR